MPWRRGWPKFSVSFVLELVAGLIAYFETRSLSELAKSFSYRPEDALLEMFRTAAEDVRFTLPVFVISTYLLLRIARLLIELFRARGGAKRGQDSRNDLEELLFEHLARAQSSSSAPPTAEILNRLSIDVQRCVGRSSLLSQRRQAAYIIIGKLYFFFHDGGPALALTAVATTILGAWVTLRASRPLAGMDHSLLAQEDRARARFEDFLRAVPEAQSTRDLEEIRSRLRAVHDERRDRAVSAQSATARVQTTSAITFIVAFGALCFVLIFLPGPEVMRAALLAVLVSALPDLFTQASVLVTTRASLAQVETSRRRLLEYDAGLEEQIADAESVAPLPPENAEGLILDNVTHQYTPGAGGHGGGITGVNLRIPKNGWLGLVGGSGSGKSILLAAIAGRARPDSGSVLFRGRVLDKLSPDELAQTVSYLRQASVCMDSTIGENLFLEPGKALDADVLKILEATGLYALCRTKALSILPTEAGTSALFDRVVELRPAVRASLTAAGLKLAPFESVGNIDVDGWKVEEMFAARVDRKAAVEILTSPRAIKVLDTLSGTTLGRKLITSARVVMNEAQSLLKLPTYAQYMRLAPAPIDEAVWTVRVRVALAPGARSAPALRDLIVVALTARSSDLPALMGDRHAAQPLHELLGPNVVPLRLEELNPHLRLRENLVYGRIEASHRRAEARADAVIVEALSAAGLDEELARLGLGARVGRAGALLTSSQRQVLALTRTLIRRTPLVVLDDPAQSLDPTSRKNLVMLLSQWAKDHVVVTGSHDDLAGEGTTVVTLDAGRLSERQ